MEGVEPQELHSFVVKFERFFLKKKQKKHLIKKRLILICVTKVHEIKRELKYERECRVLTSPLSVRQWLIIFNPEIYFMHVISKQKTTLLKNKYNLSLLGTNRLPNH
jgi:hypothetical protein